MSTEIIKTAPLPSPTALVGKAKSWMKLAVAGRRRYVVALVAMAAVVAIGFGFRSTQSSAAQYMTARVERGNLRNTVTATGTLQAVTTVLVGSQASGTISALNVDFNSRVKKGQVIAQLDPSEAQAQVISARANLEQARAGLAQARAGVLQSRAGVGNAQAQTVAAKSTVQNQAAGVLSARANLAVMKAQSDDALAFLRQQESLLKAGVIAQREYDIANTAYKSAQARHEQAAAQLNQAMLSEQSATQAGMAQSQSQVQQSQAQVQQSQAQVQAAEAQVQQAQAALQLAQISLQQTTITSPIDGVVVSRDVDVGQTVAASLSAPTLFTIANDLTQMQVIANIDQADIGLVEQAKGVQFTVDAFPSQSFTGKIQQIRLNPVNTQNVVTYNVAIEVSNPEEKLKPGMTTNLTFTIDERNNVLRVPNAALRFTPQDAERTGNGQRQRAGGANGQDGQRNSRRSSQGQEAADAGGNAAEQNRAQSGGQRASNFAPPSAPVLPGQTRIVWVMGQEGKPERRRITVGLSDGAATEVVEGNLQEGDTVITGQNVTSAARTQSTQAAPGFGGGTPRMGGGGGRR
ncbi:MAG TPA: efflux RND transporter periplasmic adaptor subunit [Pyrinomonadaceae bacterium]|nr:efflux RND transporter periplasmic adaptor subunit [Pyrinomonadaceae bacterium]